MRLISTLLLLAAANAFTAPGLNNKVSVSSAQADLFSSPLFRRDDGAGAARLGAVPEQFTELPEKLYLPKEKETPKVLGGLQIGLRKLVVVTGASSGLGLFCADALLKTGRYFVVCAVRDTDKMKTCEISHGVG